MSEDLHFHVRGPLTLPQLAQRLGDQLGAPLTHLHERGRDLYAGRYDKLSFDVLAWQREDAEGLPFSRYHLAVAISGLRFYSDAERDEWLRRAWDHFRPLLDSAGADEILMVLDFAVKVAEWRRVAP
jgi:hypothetical protein